MIAKVESDLLFIDEAAALAKKPVATMRWRRATGQPPRSGRLGRRVVYRRQDVEAWIASAFEEDGDTDSADADERAPVGGAQ